MALLCEVGLLVYTFAYERQISPVGVFTLYGLAGTGGLTLLIELLKLPLAVHSNGTRGLYRLVVMGFVLLLCGMTFMTVKDLVNNQAILSLAPAKALFAEADRLEAENAGLEDARDRRQDDASIARSSIASAEAARDSRLDALRAERSAEAALWAGRISAVTAGAGMSPVEQAEMDELAAERERVGADGDRDLATLDERLGKERRAHAAHVEGVAREFEARMVAWERECERQQADRAGREAAAAASMAARLAAFERAMAAFEASKSRLRTERTEIDRELARRIADHEAKDGAFYNLSSKIKSERAWAAAEFARIDAASSSLVRPESPSNGSAAASTEAGLPPRPVAVTVSATSPEVDRLLVERRARVDRCDQRIAAIDAEIVAIRESAKGTNAARNTGIEAEVARLAGDRDARISELDAFLATVTARFDRELTDLRAAASTPAEIQAFIKASTESIDANLPKIDDLRHEAGVLREATEMHRLAAFLRPFMPDATWEERAAVAQTAQAIVLAFIAAIAPAFLLKMAMGHVIPRRSDSHGKPGRRSGGRRRGNLAIGRLRRRQVAELARHEARSTRLIEGERRRNEAIEMEASQVATLHETELERVRAESVCRVSAIEAEKTRDEARIRAEGELAITRQQANLATLEAEVEMARRERDVAVEQATRAEAEVSNRREELERATIRRQQLRDQQLEDAIEKAEIRARLQADRRVREDVAGLRARIEGLTEEIADLRKDRSDLIGDNQGQAVVIRRHVRTITEMREELERLGRTLIDVTEGRKTDENVDPPGSEGGHDDLEIDFDVDDDPRF